MVALNSQHGNRALFQLFQALNSMNQRLGIDCSLVEQVARNHHKVDVVGDSVVDDIPEGATEIIEALPHSILLIAQVCIRNMKKRGAHETSPYLCSRPRHKGAYPGC